MNRQEKLKEAEIVRMNKVTASHARLLEKLFKHQAEKEDWERFRAEHTRANEAYFSRLEEIINEVS